MNNLISLYDKDTCSVDVNNQDFNKVFDTISHIILMEKLTVHRLDR